MRISWLGKSEKTVNIFLLKYFLTFTKCTETLYPYDLLAGHNGEHIEVAKRFSRYWIEQNIEKRYVASDLFHKKGKMSPFQELKMVFSNFFSLKSFFIFQIPNTSSRPFRVAVVNRTIEKSGLLSRNELFIFLKDRGWQTPLECTRSAAVPGSDGKRHSLLRLNQLSDSSARKILFSADVSFYSTSIKCMAFFLLDLKIQQARIKDQ